MKKVKNMSDDEILSGRNKSVEISSNSKNISLLHKKLDSLLGVDNYRLSFFGRDLEKVRYIILNQL